jgi:acetyltransferase
VLAADALIANGGELARLSDETMAKLNEFLPPHWSHGNPVDIIGDADSERYAKAAEVISGDPSADGMLAILTPQAMTDPATTARRLESLGGVGKPVLASWMGGDSVAEAQAIFARANIPTFSYPDSAVLVFLYMWQYSENLRALYETPMAPDQTEAAQQRDVADGIIDAARRAGRTLLTEHESKQLLTAYGIPTVPTTTAASKDEAVAKADQLGYPVVLKLLSQTITHKTDVGGVRLNLHSPDAVREAFRGIQESVATKAGDDHFLGVTVQPMIERDGYELILGSSVDAQFGPVLLFGAGGELVEIFQDHALGLPPLNTTLARRMMERTRIFKALHGVRGRPPVDLAALEQLVVRFSQLAVEQRWIREIDINPLLASPHRIVALDARVVLHDAQADPNALPRAVIRPYPAEYVTSLTLRDGTPLELRPIRPDDEPLMVRFHEMLSEESVYFRYFGTMSLGQRTAHERLIRICCIDYDREIALIAVRRSSEQQPEIMAVGRLIKMHAARTAEMSLVVADRFQHLGLGTELSRQLLRAAEAEGMLGISAVILPENQPMLRICRRLGFELEHDPQAGVVRANITLAHS